MKSLIDIKYFILYTLHIILPNSFYTMYTTALLVQHSGITGLELCLLLPLSLWTCVFASSSSKEVAVIVTHFSLPYQRSMARRGRTVNAQISLLSKFWFLLFQSRESGSRNSSTIDDGHDCTIPLLYRYTVR